MTGSMGVTDGVAGRLGAGFLDAESELLSNDVESLLLPTLLRVFADAFFAFAVRGVLDAEVFFDVDLEAPPAVFFAALFVILDFFSAVFFGAVFLVAVFFSATAFFLAAVFFAGVFFTTAFFLAAVFLAAAFFLAGAFFLADALVLALAVALAFAAALVFAFFAAMVRSILGPIVTRPGKMRARKLPEPSTRDYMPEGSLDPEVCAFLQSPLSEAETSGTLNTMHDYQHARRPFPVARRLRQVRPFRVVEVLERAQALARDGVDVIHLEVGEPDFATPAAIVRAGQQALADGHTRYTEALGLSALRLAVSDHYQSLGVAVDPGRIIITNGASGALTLAAALLLDSDTELLVPDPGYPCNGAFAALAGARPVALPVSAIDGYQPTPRQVASLWGPQTRALIVATPSNPTGSMLSSSALAELNRVVREARGTLIVDEIYQGLTFGEKPTHQTALALADDLIVINSFSKYFAMTGWRLGWMVVPEPAISAATALAQNLFIAPSAPAQHAALEAFSGNVLALCESRRQELERRRRTLLDGLKALGFGVPVAPEGAFYVLADLAPLQLRGSGRLGNGLDGVAFCSALLDETGVALTPGVDFGDHDTALKVRFAFTQPVPRIQEALERIEAFCRRNR